MKKLIPKKIKEKIKRKMWKNKLNKYIEKNTQQYYLFGTPLHGNIGDQAIVYSEYKFLANNNVLSIFEIPSFERKYIINEIKKKMNKNSIILIHGGGFIGNEWTEEEKMIEEVLTVFQKNNVVIFPQTIFFKEKPTRKEEIERAKKIFNNCDNLTMCLREEKSYIIAKEMFENANILLIPDMVLYLKEYNSKLKRDKILLCLRSDPEAKITNEDKQMIRKICEKYNKNIYFTDTVIAKKINKNDRKKELIKKLDEISTAKLMVTDRLHGMIFAAITKTPCIVIGTYNHKVKGVYQWIKNLSYIKYIDNLEKIEEELSKLYGMNVEKYQNINENLYSELGNIITKNIVTEEIYG